MSGFRFGYHKDASPVPDCGVALIGKSTQIHAGDILIRTNAIALNGSGTSGPAVVRPLFSGDTITTSNGIFGVALFDVQTDSNGNITTVSSPVTVDNRGKLDVWNMLLNVLPPDSASGFMQLYVGLFNDKNVWAALTGTNIVANFYLAGRQMGITASAASAPSNYVVNDTAADANAPLICDSVDTEYPQYNSANGGGQVFVVARQTFNQQNTGTLWTT